MYLRLQPKVLDIEEVQQLLMVMEQLETVGVLERCQDWVKKEQGQRSCYLEEPIKEVAPGTS